MSPRAERIGAEPAPQGCPANLSYQSLRDTSRRISERESRESGSCKRCGSSQARALTWTTTLGGKAGGSPAPRLRLQARKSREGESLAPLADNLARSVQASSDDVVGESFRRKQHDLGSDHITIR